MQDLLKLADLTTENILEILNLADQLKYEQRHGIEHPLLKGKTLGLIFEKPSTRTRVSFEAGFAQLGGHPLYMPGSGSQMGRGEPIRDTARVLSRYLDGIMIRTFSQEAVQELADYADIPVINGLTDYTHPCQVLADLMTIREFKGKLEGLKLCYIGDGNNMMNALIVGGLLTGMTVTVACPEGYDPHPDVQKFAADYPGKFEIHRVPIDAAKDADVVYTDVWSSMGMEEEAEKRQKAFAGYQVNAELMAVTKAGCMVQHCLPAHREEEITEEVLEAHADEIFEEAENRMHVQKAIMVLCMKDEK
ncbi:MAG: ornithine carbamoyltransferase [Eubacteriales bacterium]|nr:ornithine carbamoyltransferase [Eubacteriales bacterium]